MIQQNVLDKFKELFGADGDIRVYFAPGYAGGFQKG